MTVEASSRNAEGGGSSKTSYMYVPDAFKFVNCILLAGVVSLPTVPRHFRLQMLYM